MKGAGWEGWSTGLLSWTSEICRRLTALLHDNFIVVEKFLLDWLLPTAP